MIQSHVRAPLAFLVPLLAVALLPAAAQADSVFYAGGQKVDLKAGVKGSAKATIDGKISTTTIKVECQLSYTGSVSNNPTSGVGAIESTTFASCVPQINGAGNNCTVTAKGTAFSWPFVAVQQEDLSWKIELSGVKVELTYATEPGKDPACPLAGQTYIVKGNPNAAPWTNGTPSTIKYSSTAGLAVWDKGEKTELGKLTLTSTLPMEGTNGDTITLAGS